MRHVGAHIVLLLVLTGLCAVQGVTEVKRPTLRIPRVSRPPKLEDFLNGTPPEVGVQVTGFLQREPGDGVPVTQETTAYLSYDDRNLYVVFTCKDEPSKIRARMFKRDDVINTDDLVAINLDTFRDHQHCYTFGTNPLGIQYDAIITAGQGRDMSFDTLWYSEGRLIEDGFIIWMAIPFKSLRFSNAPPVQTWGMALGRAIRRNNELSYWPYITRRVEGFASQFANLEGLEQISSGRNLQFIPYGIFTRARFLDTSATGGPGFRAETERRGGLDAKIVLRDALTLDIALNPDFSQVESDEPQVTVNQRFEVFFPERRPFFIENANLFRTPINLFFSRRIADPQLGVRLTGKVGRWAIGGLAIDDRAPGKRAPETDPLHDRRASIGVVRVQRDFAEQSSIGLLITSRDFASSSNRVFSLDTRYKLNSNWILSGQVVRSYSRQLDGEQLSGSAYFAELQHSGRHFMYSGRYSERSPSFRSQLGFIPRVDIRQMEHVADYRWRPRRFRVVSVGPNVTTLVNWDRQGHLQDWLVNAGFGIEFTGQTALEVKRSEAFELFQEREFRKHSTTGTFRTEWLKWLAVSGSYSLGTNINISPASGLVPFLANSVDGKLELTLRPTPQLRFDQMYIYSRLGLDESSASPGVSASASIFNNHILRSKLNYQFTRELSLRAIFDYNAVLPNTSLVALERAKHFTADILVTYMVNPGTAVYVGYADGYENLAISPDMLPTLRRTVSPTMSTGRQLFVKMSYLFRF